MLDLQGRRLSSGVGLAEPDTSTAKEPHMENLLPRPALMVQWGTGSTRHIEFDFHAQPVTGDLKGKTKVQIQTCHALWLATTLTTPCS